MEKVILSNPCLSIRRGFSNPSHLFLNLTEYFCCPNLKN